MQDRIQRFEAALLSMDRVQCRDLFLEAAAEGGGLPGAEALLAPALARLGERWEAGELALSQIYMAGRISEDLLTTLLGGQAGEVPTGPRVAVAVLKDHHQLGKRIVAASLRAGGFQVVDLGHGLDPEDLARQALAAKVPVLMVSVLMYHSALQVPTLIRALGEARPRVVVGGAPFRLDQGLWRTVGADAVGTTGVDAVALAHRMLEEPCLQ